jgi:hypothetical protein
MRHLITAAAVIGILSMATTASAQTVTLDVSSVLYVSAHRVLVEGTLTCDQTLEGELDIVLTGNVHPGTVVPQPQTQVFPFTCSGVTGFTIAVDAIRGIKFHVGQVLNVDASFVFCGETSCTGVSANGDFKVVRS